ncbi:GCN5-related N-acetyltransferase, partial [Pseudomonas syringae pv. japonica str. M301072]
SGFRILSPGHAEVGYLLLPEHQGKGFGTESCRAIIDYV